MANIPDTDTEETIPQDILDHCIEPSETVQLSTSADIRLDGTFGTAYILATESSLFTVTPNGGTPHIQKIPLSEITNLEVKDLFGSGHLKARTQTEGATVARFTKGQNQKFNRVTRKIEDLVKKARDTEDKIAKGRLGRAVSGKRCDTCGTVIPRWVGVCPSCLDTRRLLFRLLAYALPFWKLGALSLTLLLTATFISLTSPLLLAELIDNVFGRSEAIEHSLFRDVIYSLYTPTSVYTNLYYLVGLLIFINLSQNGLRAVRTYILSILGQKVTYSLRNEVYQHLHRHSLSFYNDRETGTIMASITQDVGRLQDFISDGLQEIIKDVITILIICSILFALDAQLAALVLIPTPLLVLTTLKFGHRLHRTYRGLFRRWAGISALLADTIPGVRVVKAFAQEDREVGKFRVKSSELLEGEIKVAGIRSIFGPVMAFITSMGIVIIWLVGGTSVIEETLSIGSFVAFTSYMMRFYGPVESLCRLNHRFQRAASSAERVFEVLDTQPDVTDRQSATTMPAIKGEVEFRSVNFAYEPGKPVLKDLSFTVAPGEMIGLAGHSGAGKSTLINLICRFYDVEDGTIAIDGHDIREVHLRSLREQIGVVLQDPFLFNGPIADNIAYGNPDATLEAIVAAAKAANAHEFILGLPDSYDTPVGERGVRLSGGQRQRISIARAILRNPRILILDEATSSMDTETESQIQEALHRLIQGRTTFAIAHRLSTLKHADRLLIIDDGELAEIGSHDELIALDGIYARLCRMQTEMSKIRAV